MPGSERIVVSERRGGHPHCGGSVTRLIWPASRRGGGGGGAFRTALVLAMVAGASGACTAATIRSTGGTTFSAWHQDTARAARFIFAGDTGTGNDRARRVAARIGRQAEAVPVSHVFLLGDNAYPHGSARSIASRFLDVYRGVFSLGVRIHAALGNHDVEHCRDSGLRPVRRDESAYERSSRCEVASHLGTPEFGYLDSFRYYSREIFGELPGSRGSDGVGGQDRPQSGESPLVEVFVLDSNTLGRKQTKLTHGSDEPQLSWLSGALQRSSARWKVVATHHPVYTPRRCRWFGLGCRGEDEALRAELEPIFREHGVDVVFQAHQHLYARLRPQRGIRYFVTGGGGRKPDSFREDERTVPREDHGSFNHFVYVRATEDEFGYCIIDAEGRVRDAGSFARGGATDSQVSPCSDAGAPARPPDARYGPVAAESSPASPEAGPGGVTMPAEIANFMPSSTDMSRCTTSSRGTNCRKPEVALGSWARRY